jgi:hypothetical protein
MSTEDSGRVDPSTGHLLRPQAREDGLIVQDVGDESLVYDRDRDVAHCLSRDAADVWRACDGDHDVAGLAAQTGIAEEQTADALDALELNGLLTGEPPTTTGARTVSRRSALKRIGTAGLAATTIPLIVSATIGAPLAHASGGTVGLCETCTITGPGDTCASGFVCDADHHVCIPMGCSFVPCTVGASCTGGFFPATCTTGCTAGGTLCCGGG